MKKLNSKEILNLPKDDFSAYMRDVENTNYDKNFNASLPLDYNKLSYSTKLSFWVEHLNQSMRLQVEKGLDEYLLFTPKWYKSLVKIEPQTGDLINDIFEKFSSYGWSWNKREFLKRISPK